MKVWLLVICLMTFYGCATTTKIDSDNKKALMNRENGDIVWNQKIYSPHWFTKRYDTEELFSDHKPSKELIQEANNYQKQVGQWVLTGVYAFVLSNLVLSNVSPAQAGLSLWFLVGFGVFPTIHLRLKAEDAAEQAVEEYNQNGPKVLSISWTY